jgi:hypothetical protein
MMILLFLSVNQAQANVKPVGHDLTRKREAGEGTAIRCKVGDAETLLDLHAIESLHLLNDPDHVAGTAVKLPQMQASFF